MVREAFRARGHDAWSIDLLPCEDGSPYHIQADVRSVTMDWDLAICHPPCTDLAGSGARWFPEKREFQWQSIEFVIWLANMPVPKICVENPVGILSTRWRKPDQIIQPWQFGEDAQKRTCLWLKGLPKLVPTQIVLRDRYANMTPGRSNNVPERKDRWKIRSRTYQGIARAFANQWG